MVKRKIVWSHRAKIKLFQLLDFYAKRNKSVTYSKKLFKKFNKELAALLKQPEIGIKTTIDGVRGLIVDEFILFYEITTDKIIVHTVWDCRQNPNDLIIKNIT
ncbi:MAG: type II toxin-antitoxin system RelE/ParE family toxin [Flavobacteriales bacterium]|nr:type II toxin-antitoxin system RelE/ParE family toxin [Flavobacteriales bacterium]